DLAGEARPAVGGVDRSLLVARVEDVDALAEAAVVDGGDVAAAQGEHAGDAFILEGAGDDVAADEDLGHHSTSFRLGSQLTASTRGRLRSSRKDMIDIDPGDTRTRW